MAARRGWFLALWRTHRLPYDVAFFRDRAFEAMGGPSRRPGATPTSTRATEPWPSSGSRPGPGRRQALAAAGARIARMEEFSRSFGADLGEPLRLGVGMHTGPAVVGEMGYRDTRYLTAVATPSAWRAGSRL
jgi:adenylate cyclase